MIKLIDKFFRVDNEFFTYVLVLVGIYFAQTCFKISACRKDGTFSFKELFNGMIDYAIYFVGVVIFFFAGSLIPQAQIIPLADKYMTVDDALTALAYGLMIIQAVKCFKNIKDTFKITDEALKEAQSQLINKKELG